MNRIIACAFSLDDVKNVINTVLKERPNPAVNNDEEEEENDDFDSDETEEKPMKNFEKFLLSFLWDSLRCKI